MEEINQTIGSLIRDLRKQRGLTQAEAAGDIVTRNMLSLIEHGSAAPSLTTLRALASRLDVPVGYFFAQDETEQAQFLKMRWIQSIEEAFTAQKFAECLQLCDALPRPDAEIRLLQTEAHLGLAARHCREYALASAAMELEKAVEAAQSCPYIQEIQQAVDFALQLLDSVRKPEIPEEICHPALYPDARIPAEMFAYATVLRMLEHQQFAEAQTLFSHTALIHSEWYRTLIQARLHQLSGAPEKATALLTRLLGAPDVGFFTRYHALSAMEHCASDCGDYKTAYQYSTRKVHLLEQFSR